MTAYYNENDPKAAAWLRELISQGHLPVGDVDERDIKDVVPAELAKYVQCHFFAGIGGWPFALRLAGWPNDRPVWTGSCPCQPFSAAGRGDGFADERHLWPHFHWLIAQRRPSVVFGEQVASKDGLVWLDLVQTDVEETGFAFWAHDLCAAGIGSPNVRQRLYWVAYADFDRLQPQPLFDIEGKADFKIVGGGDSFILGDPNGRAEFASVQVPMQRGFEGSSSVGELADTHMPGLSPCQLKDVHGKGGGQEGRAIEQRGGSLSHVGNPDRQRLSRRGTKARSETGAIARIDHASQIGAPGPTNGFWRDADWLLCRDGKWRPVEPGTLPVAYGVPARVGRLRGYGNAINPYLAAEFIKTFQEIVMGV